ncbi:extracellular solute-binding protein [soil metagenome]
MSGQPVTLRGITWGHARGLDPLVACSEEFARRTGIRVDWDVRSLQGFADASLAELARTYDFVIFDHPHLGQVVGEGAFLPLESGIPAASIEDWRANSVGPSFASYELNGSLWGAPVDAAGTIAAWRGDLLESIGRTAPTTWPDVLDLARKPGHRVAVALLPIDALTAFFTVVANAGHPIFESPNHVTDEDAGVEALELLRELTLLAHPMSLQASPIHILEKMSTDDDLLYSPLVFGYSNYCRVSFRDHLVRFGPFPTAVPGSVHGGVLGGAGMGVSAHTEHPDAAFAYLDYVMSGETQRGLYTAAGGQPGHRSAWTDEANNELTGGYFRDTLPSLDGQIVRPRHAGYLLVQDEGGHRIHRYLAEGGSARECLADVDAIYVASQG